MELFIQLLMLLVGIYDSFVLIVIFINMLKTDGFKISCQWKEILILLPILFCLIIGRILDVDVFYTNNLFYYLVIEVFIGLAFTWHYTALRTLGINWCDSEKPKKSGRLITRGVYSIVRHPIYTAFFIEGISVAFISLYTLGFGIALCFIPFYRLLILKEEESLIQAFGENYINYVSIVRYRLLPFIW